MTALPHESDSHRRPGSPEAPHEGVVRTYRRPMPATWWLEREGYRRFMLREATALFVAGYAVFLLVLCALDRHTFEAVLTHPLSPALHLPVLMMAGYHSITWFRLAPQVLVLRRRGRRIDPRLIAAAHYAGWLLVTVAVLGIAAAAG